MSVSEYIYRLKSAGSDTIAELIDSELSGSLETSEDQISRIQGLVMKFTQLGRDPTTLRILHQLEFNFEGVVDASKCPAIKYQHLLRGEWFQCSFVIVDYSSPETWLKRCIEQKRKGYTVVALSPVRTYAKWFHDYVLKEADEVRFVQGKVNVNGQVCKTGDCIVIYRGVDNTSINSQNRKKRETAVTIFNCAASFTEPGFDLNGEETSPQAEERKG